MRLRKGSTLGVSQATLDRLSRAVGPKIGALPRRPAPSLPSPQPLSPDLDPQLKRLFPPARSGVVSGPFASKAQRPPKEQD